MHELRATENPAPGQFTALAREVVDNDATLYTGSKIRGSNIESTTAHAPGTILREDDYFVIGQVTIAFVIRPDRFSWAFWRYLQSGEMRAAHLQINRRHVSDRGVYSHELAHALGFAHPRGLENVPERSIMRSDHGDTPTRFDIEHGRILYLRPPNSRTPDDDPAGFFLDALRAPGARGNLVTRSSY